MSEHWLKTAAEFYDDVANGLKPFEVRIDDRYPRYEVGDILHLQEYSDGNYSGRECEKRVIYALRDTRYCKEGYVILGLCDPLTQSEPLSFEALQGMNDQMVYVRIPNDFGADLIIPSLVACNADNDDDPDEVYLTNNLGGRSTYDEVIDEGGAVYARKPREEGDGA